MTELPEPVTKTGMLKFFEKVLASPKQSFMETSPQTLASLERYLILNNLTLNKSSFSLVLRSKDEERAGLRHRDGFLFQLQISHWAGSGTFWNGRVLLLIITWWPERQPADPIWAEAHKPRTEHVGGNLPGKSAGGNGSLISLTLDSNSSILSCRFKKRRWCQIVNMDTWPSSHLYLGSCRDALDPFGSLLCQLLCQKSFLLRGLIGHVWPAETKRFTQLLHYFFILLFRPWSFYFLKFTSCLMKYSAAPTSSQWLHLSQKLIIILFWRWLPGLMFVGLNFLPDKHLWIALATEKVTFSSQIRVSMFKSTT